MADLKNYSVAYWQAGTQVICIKNYDDMRQGDKGVIIDWEGFWSSVATISYRDGAGQVKVNSQWIEDYFARI